MMYLNKSILILAILWLLMLVSPLLPHTGQDFAPEIARASTVSCPEVVKKALETVDQRCANTGRNSACYGNVKVDVQPQANAPKFTFDKPGDKVPLNNIEVLRLNSLSTDESNWGISLLRVQANLPDTAPGQNVTMLLFGNVQLSDSSKTAVHPPDIQTALVPPPTTSATQAATGKPTATARPTLTPKATLATTSAYKTMQAFYFSSGVGEPSCKEAPEDGILIQSPQGNQKIDLLIDEARVVIGSTVFVQAQAGQELIVNTLEGAADVSAFGQLSIARAGSRVRVPIDANLKAAGPPSAPEPYDLNVMQPVPAQHLPRKIKPATPILSAPPGFIASAWRITYSSEVITGGAANFTCIPSGSRTQTISLATDASGKSIWWGGVTFTGSGGSYLVDFDYTVQDSFGITHQVHAHADMHMTSPTHGGGVVNIAYTAPPPHFCHWDYAYQLDKIGGATQATAAATTTP